jgi:hypothetical protein
MVFLRRDSMERYVSLRRDSMERYDFLQARQQRALWFS